MKLYSAVGDKCFMFGERSLGRIDQLKSILDCNSPLPLPAHGTVFQFNHSTTISDVVHTTKELKGENSKNGAVYYVWSTFYEYAEFIWQKARKKTTRIMENFHLLIAIQ